MALHAGLSCVSQVSSFKPTELSNVPIAMVLVPDCVDGLPRVSTCTVLGRGTKIGLLVNQRATGLVQGLTLFLDGDLAGTCGRGELTNEQLDILGSKDLYIIMDLRYDVVQATLLDGEPPAVPDSWQAQTCKALCAGIVTIGLSCWWRGCIGYCISCCLLAVYVMSKNH